MQVSLVATQPVFVPVLATSLAPGDELGSGTYIDSDAMARMRPHHRLVLPMEANKKQDMNGRELYGTWYERYKHMAALYSCIYDQRGICFFLMRLDCV